MEMGANEAIKEDDGTMRRIARFIRLKLVVNAGLTLAAAWGYLSQPDTVLLLGVLLLLADTAFIWPYWLLTRRGRGGMATYASLSLSAATLAVGVHLSGGFATAPGAIYVLLVLAGGLITWSEAGPIIVAGISTAIYLFLAGIEYFGSIPSYGEGPPAASFAPLALIAVAGILASIWVAALVSRVFLRTVKKVEVDLQLIVAEERERAAENARLLAEREGTLAQQSRLIETVRELSTPIVPLMEGIVALPLVGHMDEIRAHRILDSLLNEVARRRPRAVLLDITGLASVDRVAVEHLAQMAQGVRLLGAKVILVGIRAALAGVMADLGLDATQVTARRDMQSGIAYALARADRTKAMTQMTQWELTRED